MRTNGKSLIKASQAVRNINMVRTNMDRSDIAFFL